MHEHVGVVPFLVFLMYYILARFLVLQVTSRYPDSAVGKALAVLS